ncbi:hypothetical protein CXF86_14025 [Shewanella sp. GutCb]|uniref:hypothetical protein n=1 Tax=Shewanella sp. GutCb TaxID=2058315 RepID=UPI000C7B0EFB|nr:hypothetical protein [Shewanella sp. GutCb]PKG74234.1 hypothetical protein CXF86_14025 [Shewanella sp. GutCb]
MNSNNQVKNDSEAKGEDTEIGTLPMWLKVSLVFVLSIAISILFLYFGKFNGPLGTQETFAQFGDFLGGTLNPILGFATIGLLIWSINIQMKELRLTREELAATKSEAEKSRLALEGQVLHLKKESYLNELTRVLKEQNSKYNELIKQPVASQSEVSYAIYGKSYPPKLIICCHNLIESEWDGETFTSSQKEACTKYVNRKMRTGGYETKQWNDITRSLISVFLLTVEYHQLSENSYLSGIYIYELSFKIGNLTQLVGDSALIQCDDVLKSILESEDMMKSLEEAISDLFKN